MNTTEPVTKDFGPRPDRIVVTMTSVTDHEGIYITTVAAGSHNSTLSRNFPLTEIESARIFYGHIKDAAKAGKAVYQIEAEISALIDASRAVDVEALAEAINADLDAAHTARVTAYEAEQAAVADIKADCTYRRVRNTKTQVFRKPLDPAQVRAIQLHRDGVVYAGNGITRPTLAALADKGMGTLNYQPGLGRRRVIASVTLNQAGLDAAAQQTECAA